MNEISIEVKKDGINEYEIKSLIGETPDFLIPMTFIEYEDCYNITYDYSGYVPLCETECCLTARDIFDCLEAIIVAYRKSHLHLIFPERIKLGKENIYINRRERSIKILFVPQCKNDHSVPKDELYKLATEMQNMYITKEAYEYVEMFKGYLKDNCGLRELQNRVLMIKREALICGIN